MMEFIRELKMKFIEKALGPRVLIKGNEIRVYGSVLHDVVMMDALCRAVGERGYDVMELLADIRALMKQITGKDVDLNEYAEVSK